MTDTFDSLTLDPNPIPTTEAMDAREVAMLQNDLYRVIYPHLIGREMRGSNAHSRTQTIMESVVEQMKDWIARQKRVA